MSVTEIEDRVRDVITGMMVCHDNDVQLTTHLRDDLGMDDIDRVELAMDLEDEFGIDISDEQAERFNTVSDVVTHLQKNIHD